MNRRVVAKIEDKEDEKEEANGEEEMNNNDGDEENKENKENGMEKCMVPATVARGEKQ